MNPSKEIFGLIGFPVRHSLSPLMHNAAFKALGIEAGYELFELKPQELEPFLKTLTQKNISGLNVTIPYKEQVLPFLGTVSAQAQLIAAVNTIKVSGSGLEGFNTDSQGFLMHLAEDLRFSPRGKIICVIGAGGAARAVTTALSAAGAGKISVYDIENDRCEKLIFRLKENFSGTQFVNSPSPEELEIGNSDLLVNATPIGMNDADPLIIDPGLIKKGLLVYDLIYNPKETKLLKAARQRGAAVSNGLGMLLYQGMLSFEIWTGKQAPKEIMRKALEEGVC